MEIDIIIGTIQLVVLKFYRFIKMFLFISLTQ